MRNRRVVVTHTGGPEAIEIVEDELADPAPGDVQLRVLASGVAYGDVLKRRGLAFAPGTRPPFTPGYDLVGEVEGCGAGADRFRPGDRVAAFVMSGANAERVHVPERLLVPVAAGIDSAEAVALVLDYVTAWQMLHRVARVQPGARILVHGAGGGVGSALLELARLNGITAFGTASAGKHAVVARLGAVPIDYRREDFVQAVRARTADGVDAVFDPIGGPHVARSRRALRRGGRLVAYGVAAAVGGGSRAVFGTFLRVGAYRLLPFGRTASFYGIGGLKGRDDPTIREDLARILALRVEGKLAPIVGAMLPLTQARRAHEMKERAEVAGKVVLLQPEPAA